MGLIDRKGKETGTLSTGMHTECNVNINDDVFMAVIASFHICLLLSALLFHDDLVLRNADHSSAPFKHECDK